MPKKTMTRIPRTPVEGTPPHCGLCRKTGHLTRTDCCSQWICDDEHTYVLFSYARNSCHRNHTRYTLCGYHHNEGHAGDWKTCPRCRESFETEMYVWYGTNDYNFEKLPHPPAYQPTRCATCGTVIRLGEDGSMRAPDGQYYCMACADVPDSLRPTTPRRRRR